MRIYLTLLAAIAAVALSARALADQVPIPPSPTQWVTDNAGVLSSSTSDSLNQRLANYEKTTGHQVLVWIGPSTGDVPLEDWTIRSFTAWKVGRKGLDDGAVLFLFTQGRKVRIEVGYGLEGQLTDAISSQIIRNDVEPQMRANDPDGAVTSAVSDILATIGGEGGTSARPYRPPTSSDNGGLWGILAFLVIFFIISSLIRRGAGRRGPYVIGSGWSGAGWGGFSGGFSGGGGGFSGGGGMGGGGGASGGW